MRIISSLTLAVALTLCAQTARAGSLIDELVVFGDSLSDNGNLVSGVDEIDPPPPPYFDGRFSNGPVWVENLIPMMGLDASGFSGFAKGGKTSQQVLDEQVTPYVTGAGFNPNALHVVWAGPDDFLALSIGGDLPALIAEAVDNISESVESLANAGATNILVGNMPNLGRTPLAIGGGFPIVTAATALSNSFNSALEAELQSLEGTLGIDLLRLDAFAFGEQQIAGSPGNGLTNIDTAFLGGSRSGPADPDTYLFWDDVHPTAEAHRRLAEFAFNVIPEPASFGFLAFGAAVVLRRKR